MPSRSLMQLIQARIAEALTQWRHALPKFRALEERCQELRARLIRLDRNDVGAFRFYMELSDLALLLACCDAYEQGRRQAGRNRMPSRFPLRCKMRKRNCSAARPSRLRRCSGTGTPIGGSGNRF